MYIAQNIFHELHKFLSIDLIEENLSAPCRHKLSNLIKKLEISASRNDGLRNLSIYEESNVYEEPCRRDAAPTDYNFDDGLRNLNIYDQSNVYEEPYRRDVASMDFNFELPKKLIKCRNDLQNMTLSGALYYRYNLQCWELYPSSMLIDGRLICCKSSPVANGNNNNPPLTNDNINSPNSGKSSELSVFLIGYTAVMTGKDCGMNYVFKLTHPTEETKVFATETEEESFSWIEQINQYSSGGIPKEVLILQNQCGFNMDTLDELDDFNDISHGIDNVSLDETGKIHENSHLRRQPSDVLTVINNSTVTNPNFLISDVKFNRSRSSYSFKNVPSSGSPGNASNNNTGSIASTGGTSIISSMRRKVESFGNKYRNRKSFAGFSSKSFNLNGVSTSTTSSKARTLPQTSPDDSKRASICSIQGFNFSKDIIYSGVAKLRLQGNRAGWMERWCQLKPKLLECYHLQSANSTMKPTLDFALCLENLTLGLSNDKKHRSALRLSCDSVKQDLLFEVQDKVLMGDWIKSFIEALGISNQKSIPIRSNSPTKSTTSQTGSDDIMCRSLNTIQSIGSDSIYDEVCSSDYKELDPSFEVAPPQTPNTHYQRRWSSPAIELPGRKLLNTQPPSAPYAGRRCLRDHPLPSLPASSPDSENNSDNMADTPTGNNDMEIESIYDSTFGRTLDHSRTSTLKIRDENQHLPGYGATLNTSLIYADQDQEDSNMQNGETNGDTKFSDNREHWRIQGCSLADLIARFEPNSENHDHSSATMSSKTDSSCTPTYHNSSEDNINSISNSFMSIHSVENNSADQMKKVCRSVSADTDLSCIHRNNSKLSKRDRPKSLLMKKTSLELVLEELVTVKEDIRSLKRQKSELQKIQSQKQNCGQKESIESINTIINGISNQIKAKESRVKELSNHSRKRFTLEIVTDFNRQSSRLSAD